jgi:multiple sugar transport system permease protein
LGQDIVVDPALLYAIGTLSAWTALAATVRVVHLALALFFRVPRQDLSGGWKQAAGWSGLAAAGFLLSGWLLPPPGEGEGLRLPLIWPVMPFWAWMGAVGAAFGAVRLLQAVLAAKKSDAGGLARAGVIWLAAAVAGFWLHRSSGDSVEILRGGIRLSFWTAAGMAAAVLAALAVMVITGRNARARGLAKTAAAHLTLAAGSVVFGLPFAWLVITSFKEDRDMSSPTGLVWIPRVQQKTPYFDPDEVRVEARYEGRLVEGVVLGKTPDGATKIEIWKPAVLRGLTFTSSDVKVVPKMVDVVTATLEGQNVTGRVVKDLEDGRKRVEVMRPPALAGRVFVATPEQIVLVRPVGLKVQNYPEALDYLPPETNRGLVYLKNTLILVVLNVIGTILSSSIVAYAFARMRFPGKNVLFLVLLSTMMLPAAVTLIPQFLIFRSLGWIDTLRPLWVTAFLGSAFNIFLLRQFFMTIPLELEDAAKIDGCSYLRTFWQVMLPQIKPALAVVAIWTFLAAWNNFLGPLIYVNSPENMPISYAVQLFQSDRTNEPGLLMAFATMAMIPVLLVFFFAQKYFIEGVTLSGLGGR